MDMNNRIKLYGVLGIFLVLFTSGGCGVRLVILHDPLDAGAHNELGIRYLQEMQWKAAERAFKRAHRKQPNWEVPLLNLGYLSARLGNWKKARMYYLEAIRVSRKTCPDCWNNLAYVDFKATGPHERQLGWVEHAIRLRHKPEPSYYLTGAEILLAMRQCERSFTWLTRALFHMDEKSFPEWFKLWEQYREWCRKPVNR